MDSLYFIPEYFKYILERLVEKGWLVHNFPDLDEGEEYNPSGYIYNKDVNGVTYTICLDVNIYQFIINSVKKERSKQEYKDAICLVCFCQLAGIELDPTIAIYEKLDYSFDKAKLAEITRDLEVFNKINNISDDQLIRYVFDEIDKIEPKNKYDMDHKYIQNKLTKNRRLRNWDSLYLIILYITYTSLDSDKTDQEKLRLVVEWMITEFRMSLVCITYAIVYFSKNPIKKMMKYKLSDTSSKRKRALYNMTWDLYALNKYFEDWIKREKNHECLYASDDKAFRNLLNLSVEIQNIGSLEPLSSYLDERELEYFEIITNNPSDQFERVYDGESWGPEYRQELIDDLNKKLGI